MAKKTLGRRATTNASATASAKPTPGAKSPAKSRSKPGRPQPLAAPQHELLGPSELGLVDALAASTGLSPREVLSRALSAYAAAVAPALDVPVGVREAGAAGARLFVSVDGRKEIEVPRREFVFGSAAGVDVRLDLPLIAPRHARVLWKENSPLFEDLRSPRGSFRHGQPVDVRMIESGDEFDLGGFLPLKFRLA